MIPACMVSGSMPEFRLPSLDFRIARALVAASSVKKTLAVTAGEAGVLASTGAATFAASQPRYQSFAFLLVVLVK